MKRYLKHIIFTALIIVLGIALFYYGASIWEILFSEIFPQ